MLRAADHVENLRDGALIERVDLNVGADKRCCDIRLKIGESQDEIGFEIEDLRDVGGGERRDPWLLASRSWRANNIARDADDARFLAEKIKGLDRLLG
jgi:hypothetical protein